MVPRSAPTLALNPPRHHAAKASPGEARFFVSRSARCHARAKVGLIEETNGRRLEAARQFGMYLAVVCGDSWPARAWMAIMGAPSAASAEQAECRITWSATPFF